MKLYWMKKAVNVFLLTLLMPCSVFAHSGGTDANGGHYDGNEYHYHHGYPAHSHTDGCPYDYDDATEYSYSSSSSSAYSEFFGEYGEGYDDGYDYGYEDGYIASKKDNAPLFAAAFASPMIVAAILAFRSSSKAHKENRTIFQLQQQKSAIEKDIERIKSKIEVDRAFWNQKTDEYKKQAENAKAEAEVQMRPHIQALERKAESLQETIGFLKEEMKRLEAINDSIEKTIKEKSVKEAGDLSYLIPKDTVINSEGYPVYLYATNPTLDKYLVVINRNSQVFHHPHCQHAWSREKINIGKALETHRPCRLCEHLLPDMEWYYEYLSLQKQLQNEE